MRLGFKEAMHECLHALEPNIAEHSLSLWYPYSEALPA